MCLNKQPPFGNHLRRSALHMPEYALDLEQVFQAGNKVRCLTTYHLHDEGVNPNGGLVWAGELACVLQGGPSEWYVRLLLYTGFERSMGNAA